MSRVARERSCTGIYHIMTRGIDKQNIFEEDSDRLRYVDTLKYISDICDCEIYGYCLMNNHVHILIKALEPIEKIMKRINVSYVKWYNEKYRRCGYLFQDRYKSEVIESDASLINVLRYIHRNPVKAKVTQNVLDYQWSSIHDYMNRATFVKTSTIMEMFSLDDLTAKKELLKHTNIQVDEEYLESIEKHKVTDEEIVRKFKEYGILTISELNRLERSQRDSIVGMIKKDPKISIRQLSRVTGISKKIIENL